MTHLIFRKAAAFGHLSREVNDAIKLKFKFVIS